ncbi:MAG: 1-hydroxycarotenoid 3,4-desaturase CrtD [Bacteroidota bacterium]
MENKKALIVGSGIAGIASAIRMAVKGYAVSVYEANAYPGGKLTVMELDGYRFDAGPSLFTMPHFVEELFRLSGKDPETYFQYAKMPVACHYFFEDGTFLRYFSDRKSLLNEVKAKLNVDPSKLDQHLNRSELIFKASHKAFLERSLHKISSHLTIDTLNCIAHIPWLNLFTTMHKANLKGLNHPKLVQIFDRYATYNGSNPYKAPGILNIIPHLESGIGTYFPRKGMHSITKSLVQLAEELGVTFHYNSRVDEIIEHEKKISGIAVNGQLIPGDVVICNSDVKPAYRYLLKHTKAPKRTLEQEPSSSAMIFYWGIRKEFPQLDLHNIFFTEDYEEEFRMMFEERTVSDDPTVYVHISSKVVRSDAPDGCENWFVMVNVPSNSGQDWDALRLKIRQNVIQKLNRILKIDLESLIETEDFLDPVRIEKRTSSYAGALYGSSSNDRMAAFFRHPNFSKTKGLYFVGGSVHPGGGIPLCLLSAKIATDLVP